MNARIALCLAMALALPTAAMGDTITVDCNGSGDYETFQEAIDAALEGDTISVAPCVYTGPMNRDLDFGGKNLEIVSTHGPYATTINCEGAGRGFSFQNGEDGTSVLSGLRILNGLVPGGHGGGVSCTSSSSPTLSDLVFEQNHAAYGGGLYCSGYSSPTLEGVEFLHNIADSLGGGMACEYAADAVLTDVAFTDNECTGYNVYYAEFGGGGMYAFRSSPVLTDVQFTSNTAAQAGGGLRCKNFPLYPPSEAILTDVSFTGNAAGHGGGMAIENTTATLTDVEFVSNDAGGEGGGLWCEHGEAGITLTRVTFSDNSAISGAGLYANWTDAPMHVLDCTFSHNMATNYPTRGGGARFRGTDAYVAGCMFFDNWADTGAGVHCMDGDGPVFEYCTFVENHANTAGAGVYSQYDCSPVLTNTIIAYSTNGEAVACEDGGTVSLGCCDVYGNSGGDYVGCIASQAGVNNNMEQDPLFCGGSNLADPYALERDSPCADAPFCGQIGARPVACRYPQVLIHIEWMEYFFGFEDILCQPLVFENIGQEALEWQLAILAGPARAEPDPEPDPEPGGSTLPLRGSGGPDAFGYRWIDSDDPDGPTFQWRDITTVGFPILLGDNDGFLLPLLSPFPFYGSDRYEVWIASNGYLTFGSDWTDPSNDPVPDPNDPNDFIAPFWDNLDPSSGGVIFVHHDFNNSELIIQYTDMPRNSGGGVNGLYTFEVILKEDGSILYQYLEMEGELESATVGIENGDGTTGLEVVYDAPYVHDGLAVLISTEIPPDHLTFFPASGLLLPDENVEVEVCIDSHGLDAGTYEWSLLLSSNDYYNPEIVIPITVHIEPTGIDEFEPARLALKGNYPNPFNPRTTIAYDLPKPSRVNIEVFDVAGRHVRTLVDGEPRDAGSHTTIWNGLDASGQRVASGVYLCRLEVDGEVFSRRMVLLK